MWWKQRGQQTWIDGFQAGFQSGFDQAFTLSQANYARLAQDTIEHLRAQVRDEYVKAFKE